MHRSELPFNHFLITRFNLKSEHKSWVTDKNQSAVLDEEWMDHRIEIFKNFCYPSIQKQTNKNFTWLIYLDSSTSEEYRKILHELFRSYPGEYRLYFPDDYNMFQSTYHKDVLELANDYTTHIITTRFDNDDVAHEDFIDTIQQNFNFQTFTAINFLKIYIFDSVSQDKLYLDYIFSNHFVSLIEKINQGTVKGCYSKGDKHWNVGNDVIQIRKGTFCMELIHEKNLYNDYRGFPVLKKTDLSSFQLPVSAKTSILNRDIFKFWKMSWKKLLAYFIQSLYK